MNLPVIKNIDALATTALRSDALTILEAGYEAVLTDRVIREEITLTDGILSVRGRDFVLANYDRVLFVGIGKCAVDAADVFEEILGDVLSGGIVLDVKPGVFKKLRGMVGTHPFPSEENAGYTREIVKLLSGLTERDLVLAVISGGGSALLSLPHGVSIADLQKVTQALWKGGASITEVNTVRKHLSEVTGGQLAKAAHPATMISFIFSDVPGNDLNFIASGPTVRDETTVEQAREILAELQERLASPPPWLAQIMGVRSASLARFEEDLAEEDAQS